MLLFKRSGLSSFSVMEVWQIAQAVHGFIGDCVQMTVARPSCHMLSLCEYAQAGIQISILWCCDSIYTDCLTTSFSGLADYHTRRNRLQNMANTPGCVGSLRASRRGSPGESSGRAGGAARGGGQQEAGGALDGPFTF